MTTLGQHQENSLSCSQYTDKTYTDSQLSEQSKIAATDENGSRLELPIQSLTPLNKKDSFMPDGVMRLMVRVEEHVVVTTSYQKQETLSYSKSSNSNDDYLNGKIQKLNSESRDLKTQDSIIDTWITRWIARPIAYLFLTNEAEAWLGDIRELRIKLLCQEYPIWHQRIMEILWVTDLTYNSITERIKKLLPDH